MGMILSAQDRDQLRAATRRLARPATRSRLDARRARAVFLPKADRTLLEAAWDRGIPLPDLAAARGVPTRALRWRIAQLRRRLDDPCFILAVQFANLLPQSLRGLARGRFVEGHTIGRCAAATGLSRHLARHRLALARALLILAASERYGDRTPSSQTFLTALLRH